MNNLLELKGEFQHMKNIPGGGSLSLKKKQVVEAKHLSELANEMINNHTEYCKEVPKRTPTTKELKEYLDGLNDTSNPSYYKLGGIEPFEYMRSKMTPEEFQGYLKCNIIKYVSRMGHKINNHDDIDNPEDNRVLSTYDDACKIRKYADTLCKEVFKALPRTLQIKYAEEDEWMDIKEDNR